MSENKPKCTVCAKTFSQKFSVYKHMRNVHHIEAAPGVSLSCPVCESKVRRYTDLACHMHESHDMTIEKEELTFACMEDFNAWKRKTEKETRSLYVKDTGSQQRVDGKKRTLYRCNRDGSYRDRVGTGRKRSLQLHGSCKIEARCPSFIIMEEGAANLTITFYKNHFGHRLSLGHLFLTKEERLQIAGLLESGTQQSTVLDRVRDSCLNSDQFERIHMLTKKDLHNITRDFRLQKERLHPNDSISLDLLVNYFSLYELDCNPILSYKRQGEADEAPLGCPLLNGDDFFLVIMTQYQKKMLSDFGSDKICIDGTHGTNGYDFQLITILTVDEYASGYPLAFCITNRKDTTVYMRFFLVLKKVNIIEANIFMSDDESAFYNAWVQVMGPVKHRLLCSWHVDRNWQSNIRSKIKCQKKGVVVYKCLNVLQQECDEILFSQNMQLFLQELDEDEDTQDFANYFRSYYEHRPECWAYCHRKGLGINTNMYLESFHKVLKHIYFEGKKNKRLDTCVSALLKYTRNKMFERLIKIEKNVPTYRMRAIQKSHFNSFSINADMVAVLQNDEVFEVKASDLKQTYLVAKEKKTCSIENICPLTCVVCKICVHAYSCTCVDSLIKFNICKHIHAVVRLCSVEEHNEISSTQAQHTEADELMTEICKFKIPNDSVLASGKQSLINDIKVLEGCFRLKEMSTDKIKMAQKDLGVLLSKYNNDPLPLTINNREPTNKKMEKQRRLFSTKKNKENVKTWTKPTANEKENFLHNLGKDEAENIHTEFDHTYCKSVTSFRPSF